MAKKKSIKKTPNYEQISNMAPKVATQVQQTVAASSIGEDLSGSNENIVN
jgi:hypothetical protein